MTQVNEAGRKPWLRRRDRRARRGLPLLLLTALLLVGGGIAATVALPTPLAMRIIGSKTVHDAHVWRAEVIELLDGGAATFEAGRLSAREHERLSQITALSDIYRYKLFTDEPFDHVEFEAIADIIPYGFEDMTKAQFEDLPPRFLRDVKLALVVEANEVLGVESAQEKRRSGVLSDTVGETSQMFRSGRPMDTIIGNRAMSHVKRWVDTAWRVRRG